MTVFWLIVAVGLLIAEVVTMALFAAFLALGALAAAIAAAIGVPPVGQFLVFALASVAGVVVGRRPLLRVLYHREGRALPSGALAMVGQRALVVDPIPGGIERGHVRVAGETWLALSADETPIEAGTSVTIVELRQTTLVVRPDSQTN